MGFSRRGFIWDIPILSFAYVLFWVPNKVSTRGQDGFCRGSVRVEGLGGLLVSAFS